MNTDYVNIMDNFSINFPELVDYILYYTYINDRVAFSMAAKQYQKFYPKGLSKWRQGMLGVISDIGSIDYRIENEGKRTYRKKRSTVTYTLDKFTDGEYLLISRCYRGGYIHTTNIWPNGKMHRSTRWTDSYSRILLSNEYHVSC